jgi:cytoskeletal protein CcmA (bactofilin family)
VRYNFGRHLVLEGDFARWNGSESTDYTGYRTGVGGTGYSGDFHYESRRSGWAAGTNLLFQTGYRRVTWFAGGGLVFADQTRLESETIVGCVPPPGTSYSCYSGYSYGSRDRQWGVQALTGVDVRIAGPVMAYASLHITSGVAGSIRTTAGIRVVARSVDAARVVRARAERLARSNVPHLPVDEAIGANVRVSMENGAQIRGTLISLTATDVVIRAKTGLFSERSVEERYRLADVRLVEKTHHKARKGALIGLIGGAAAGLATAFICEDEVGYCAVVFAPLFAGMGAAGGAAVGGLADHLGAPAHVIYARSSRTVQLLPIATPKRAGLGILLRW